VQACVSPSSANSAAIAAFGWWRSPVVFPDLAAVFPTVGLAGEEQLEGLGEAGLAGAVAADDEREAGAGREVERRLRADAAEAFDGDGLEEGDARLCGLGCGCGGFCGLLCRGRCSWLAAFVDELPQLVGAFEGGEDEGRPLVLGFRVGLQPLQDEVADGGVRHAPSPSDLPCPRLAIPSAH
jgi:hypothetical protein